MDYEAVEVSARWESADGFIPRKVTWREKIYQIESTGRNWEDEAGFHVLCMVGGGQVVELLFRLRPAGWLLRLPAGSLRMA